MLLPADWWNCLLWVWIADGIAIHQSFGCNLDVLYNTSSHIYGQRYLPIFHLRDGSLTVMNNPSLIALMKFWSSLPIMLKFLMSALCPEMLQWLWMEKGDFWCSLNLSAKVLADSPIYSSSHPSSWNVNMCMTPLLMVIGSLYLGAMKKSFMVWPPFKCTCIQYFWQVFLNLSLTPCWYCTTVYMFLLIVLIWPFSLLLLFFVLIFALLMAYTGYLHFWRAWHRWSSSLFCSCLSEDTILAVWYRVPATLYLKDMVCWLYQCFDIVC